MISTQSVTTSINTSSITTTSVDSSTTSSIKHNSIISHQLHSSSQNSSTQAQDIVQIKSNQIKNYFTPLPDKSVEKRKITSPEETGPVPPETPGACNSKSFFDDIN